MPTGRGFWFDPHTNALYEVVTHNDWLLDPEHQRRVGLPPEHVQVLASLDPVREIDEIRMVGLLAGLIRLRDYYRHVSVQFYAVPSAVPGLLSQTTAALPHVTTDRHPQLVVQNLRDDSIARLDLSQLLQELAADRPVLEPVDEPMKYNATLRDRVRNMLARAQVRSDAIHR